MKINSIRRAHTIWRLAIFNLSMLSDAYGKQHTCRAAAAAGNNSLFGVVSLAGTGMAGPAGGGGAGGHAATAGRGMPGNGGMGGIGGTGIIGIPLVKHIHTHTNTFIKQDSCKE